jgi:hypothetical protein
MIRNLILALLLLPCVHTQAQRLFDIGVKAGVSRDNIRLENVTDHRGVTGWHGGLFVRLKPPLAPGVQGELLYNTMGADILGFDTVPGSATIRLRYLQLPAFLVFTLGPAELHVGGYASHLLGSTITQPSAITGEIQQLRSNQFANVDYGLLGGAGIRLGSFYAGGRYTIGLGTVGDSDNNILGNARNMQAQLYVGYGFAK